MDGTRREYRTKNIFFIFVVHSFSSETVKTRENPQSGYPLFLPPVGLRRRRNTIFTVQDLKIELTKKRFLEKECLITPFSI